VRRGYVSFPAFRHSRRYVLRASDAVGNTSPPLRG